MQLDSFFCHLHVLLIVSVPEHTVIAHEDHTHVEKRLRDHLFNALNYSALIRPVQNVRDAIHVHFNMKLMQVRDCAPGKSYIYEDMFNNI